MNRKITFLLWLSLPLFGMAQQNLMLQYEYDAAGNRTLRKVIELASPSFAPPAPQDSLPNMNEGLQVPDGELQVTDYEFEVTSDELQPEQFFIEKIAQVEMKIYPNPATEKITLEISNMENLQTGIFKLYNLNGQLLQEHPIHSVTTVVSLAGFAKGTYILKLLINNREEDWKIIKQ